MWTRQHSPLLLQVTSTNPLESYHSELKRLTSSSHSLIGMPPFHSFIYFHHTLFSFPLIPYSFSPFCSILPFHFLRSSLLSLYLILPFFPFIFVLPFTSSFLSFLGAVYNVVDIDCKKRSDSEKAAFDFCTKKISVYSVSNDIIEEIHKFPFPFQHLLVKEARAVMDRIEGVPDLSSLNCHCIFRNRYLLPLTVDAWKAFQECSKNVATKYMKIANQ